MEEMVNDALDSTLDNEDIEEEIEPVFSCKKKFQKSATVSITSNLAIYAWSIKCR